MSWPRPDARRVIVLANPKAGFSSSEPVIGRLVDRLRQLRFHADVLTDADRMADEAIRASESGDLRTVVAAGGDGTVRLAASRTGPGTPVTVLPLGTENLLARRLKLPTEPESVADAVGDGRTVCLDAGQTAGQMFLLMLGCGFDAEVVRRLHQKRRGHIHHLSYAKPIFASILRYRYPELRVSCRCQGPDGPATDHETVAHWAFVFNLPSYAGNLGIAPDADGEDGILDVCTFQGASVWHGLRHLFAVMLGRHRQWGNCVTTRATTIRITSDGNVPYQVDGDPGGFLPVEIEVLPHRLTLVVPGGWRAKAT